MQRRAQVGYDAQCHLASLSSTLPERIAKTINVKGLAASLNDGKEMTEGLWTVLANKNVPLPIPKSRDHQPITVFLLDLEGTLTPIPVIRKSIADTVSAHLKDYIYSHYPSDAHTVAHAKAAAAKSPELLQALNKDKENSSKIAAETDAVRALLLEHMTAALQETSKLPYAKQFQGDVWADAMKVKHPNEKTCVFSDVPEFLKSRGAPKAASRSRVVVYSSGSIAAQRTLLSRTKDGDLSRYVAEFLDVNAVGSKLTPKSYQKIRSHLSSLWNVPSSDLRIVFVTDNSSEASAAETSAAVESAVMCLRPGNEWMTMDTLLALNVPPLCSLDQLMDAPKGVNFGALVKDAIV